MLEHDPHEGGVVIAGDAYPFDSRTPHRFRNVDDRPCEVVSACPPLYL